MSEMDIKREVVKRIESINFSDIFIHDAVNKTEYTYTDIFSMAYHLSRDIIDDTNIVIMQNGINLLVLYFATIFSNNVIIPIDPDKGDKEIEKILNNHENAKIIRSVDVNKETVVKDLKKEDVKKIFLEIDFEKPYLITYTSGSAGEPKGVIHSFGNLMHSAINFGEVLNYNQNTCLCHVMPMTYMAGILNTIFLPFIMGANIVIMKRFSVQNAIYFWKDILEYKINTLWISPTMLHLIMLVDKDNRLVEYMRNTEMTISVGTAPLPPALRVKFEEKYATKIFQSYGLSETLFVTTEDNDSKNRDSVGSVLKDVEIEFGNDGEILLNMPWMFKGYVNENIEEYFVKKKYKTGDLGKIQNGQLVILGRKKELIIKGGINIYPKDIENCINQLNEVEECCIGAVSIKNEERIICWYVSDIINETNLNKTVVSQLGKYYKIDYFVKMNSLYKNLNGKIDKKRLLEEFKKRCF